MQPSKDALRLQHKDTLKTLSETGELEKRKQLVLTEISNAFFFQTAKKILYYKAFKDEFNLNPLAEQFPEKEWLIPEIEILEENAQKQIIPPESFIERCLDLDLIIVPGLAFDKQGYRLGRGGGYYDRLLAEIKQKRDKLPETKAQLQLIIGIIPKELYLESIPHEEHDVKMDLVLSF